MKRISIAVLLLLAVGFSTGCGRDTIQPNGAKVFGEHILLNGGIKSSRVEFPDGSKAFGVVKLPDGTQKMDRVEMPNGETHFNETL